MMSETELLFLRLILFFFFLILSAFFSSAETAYFSLSKLKIQHLKDSQIASALRVVKLLERPKHLLISILIGNTLVNVAAATVAATLASDLSHQLEFSEELAILLDVFIVVTILLLLGEILPKIVAVKNAISFSQQISFPLLMVVSLLYPVSHIFAQFTALISKMLGIEDVGVFFSQEELKTLIDVGEEKGAIEEDEKEMIHSIFEFSQTAVREIMVPRIDMVCVEKNTSFDDLIDLIKKKGKTRIPLYQGRVDNILGIIHAKDLLPYIKQQNNSLETTAFDLVSLARETQFVPENKKIDDLLREFQRERNHMAIVVDEYGGTAGLITLEDVLEEIVGEIQDEYDSEGPLFRQIDEQNFLVDGKINVHELAEVVKAPLPDSEAYDTLAGLIFDYTGYVPKEKEEIIIGNVKFRIEKIVRNRIVQVRMSLNETTNGENNKKNE